MPSLPLEAIDAPGIGEAGHKIVPLNLSEEEMKAATEAFETHCNITTFYECLRRRAKRYNPLFLQRCLDYKRKAKHKRRIKMTVFVSWWVDDTQIEFPLNLSLVRLDSQHKDADQNYTAYEVSKVYVFREESSTEIKGKIHVKAKFKLPDLHNYTSRARNDSFALLFYHVGATPSSSSSEGSTSSMLHDLTSNDESSAIFAWCGKTTLEALYAAWDNSTKFSLKRRASINLTVEMLPCFMKTRNLGQEISIQDPRLSRKLGKPKHLQVTIYAEEFRANDIGPYRPLSSSYMTHSASSHINGLKEGDVVFDHRLLDKYRVSEVSKNFTCSICAINCGSYKGIRHHLLASHDHYNFKFTAPAVRHAVELTAKFDKWRKEVIGDGINPRTQTFMYTGKQRRRGNPKVRRNPKTISFRNGKGKEPEQQILETGIPNGNGNDEADLQISKPAIPSGNGHGNEEDLQMLESEVPKGTTQLLNKAKGVSKAVVRMHPEPYSVPPITVVENGTSEQVIANKGKMPMVEFDSEEQSLLKMREFYHSIKYQPLAFEEEIRLGDDSETEDDDEITEEFEIRKRLDRFPNLSEEQKKFFIMWNSFVWKHKVVAFGHIPWTCTTFTKLHGPEFAQSIELSWAWRLHMIHLVNQKLIDGKTMNTCNLIIEGCNKQKSVTQG